ncbi:MAG: beta-phosphoglucomutase [Lachnospiraceae bacterium]|jgi:beta-phosphoglucomutase
MIQGLIFDLDGVLVDTAKYHYLAWKKIADELGIPFTLKDNERLKGVSRVKSFQIILEIGNRTMPPEEQEQWCTKKNNLYREYISHLTKDEILPGAEEFLREARKRGYKTALGSASKNAGMILDRLEISDLFDALIDGTKVSRAKPDPEVFLLGVQELGLKPEQCVVFEDAAAGIAAAHNGGMKAVGIGTRENLPEADLIYPAVGQCSFDDISRL